MVKVLLDKYPMGTVKGQKSDGRYIDGYLYNNLSDLADVIVNDMTFLAVIFSSTLEVGTGKSVLATQIGEVWQELMKKKHGIDVPYSTENIAWRPKELVEKSFKLPKYSFILLDEWEDATYWSELGMSLRQFFRKCRQLNQFVVVICPNWFQFPLSYAISRSVFAIDVRFEGKFQRGFFSFYGFDAKKKVYILGKKYHNYRAGSPDFIGRFTDGYGVPEKEYRLAKLQDLKRYEATEPAEKPTEEQLRQKLFFEMRARKPELTLKMLSELIGVSYSTVFDWINKQKAKENVRGKDGDSVVDTYTNNLDNKEVIWEEEVLTKEET